VKATLEQSAPSPSAWITGSSRSRSPQNRAAINAEEGTAAASATEEEGVPGYVLVRMVLDEDTNAGSAPSTPNVNQISLGRKERGATGRARGPHPAPALAPRRGWSGSSSGRPRETRRQGRHHRRRQILVHRWALSRISRASDRKSPANAASSKPLLSTSGRETPVETGVLPDHQAKLIALRPPPWRRAALGGSAVSRSNHLRLRFGEAIRSPPAKGVFCSPPSREVLFPRFQPMAKKVVAVIKAGCSCRPKQPGRHPGGPCPRAARGSTIMRFARSKQRPHPGEGRAM